MYIAQLLFQGINIPLFKQWSCWIWRSWWVDCTSGKCEISSLLLNAWHYARQADNCFVAKVEYGYFLTIGRSIHINHSDSFNCQGTGHGRP